MFTQRTLIQQSCDRQVVVTLSTQHTYRNIRLYFNTFCDNGFRFHTTWHTFINGNTLFLFWYFKARNMSCTCRNTDSWSFTLSSTAALLVRMTVGIDVCTCWITNRSIIEALTVTRRTGMEGQAGLTVENSCSPLASLWIINKKTQLSDWNSDHTQNFW